ncbi:MAG TPA: saccharopine dehydrogenase C-terminal domain-containing protein, partial [Planctomycetota bacterium]|nr:saccharopine dehydrogenase C-terminal domain-containing protein [Planctomycetota bacterium]
MTKKVLILGAGLVVRPIVHYLLKHNYHVTVASLIASQAENVVKNQPNGIAKHLDVVQEPEKLASEVSQHDIIVSLLPAIYHVQVAEVCLQYKKSLVTASYISPAMQELHEQALESNLLFLNECGLDPGLDHMGAMKTIHEVQKKGGKVVGYSSYCGGLPALASNNNPFQYKFSWSPVGVVKAAKNGARFLRNNEIVEIPADELFENYEFVEIPNCGTFEGYPNRNSLDYIKKYNLDGIRDMFRGTLRNIGHCETWRYFVRLGILQDEKKYDFTKISPAEVICELIGKEKSEDLFQDVADFLKIEKFSVTLHKLQWLGFFSYEKPKLTQGSVMD